MVVGGAQGFIAPQWVAAPKAQMSTEVRAVNAAFGEQCRRDDAKPSSPSLATRCKTSYQPLHGGYMTHKTEDPRKKDPGA